MLNDRRLDFKPPTTRGRTFPTRPTPILPTRKPRESEDRHSVGAEHLEVLGRAEIPDLVSGAGDLPRRPSPASSGFRRTQYLAGRVVSSRATVTASTDQCRAHRDAGPRGLPRATGVTAPRCARSRRAGGLPRRSPPEPFAASRSGTRGWRPAGLLP
jgi:hypothetical protein